jgi:hypothetical protein
MTRREKKREGDPDGEKETTAKKDEREPDEEGQACHRHRHGRRR